MDVMGKHFSLAGFAENITTEQEKTLKDAWMPYIHHCIVVTRGEESFPGGYLCLDLQL